MQEVWGSNPHSSTQGQRKKFKYYFVNFWGTG
jgi:hypothetical protein